MWSGKWLCAGIVLPALMMPVSHSMAATTTANAEVIINATFTMPTCELVMPATVQLGWLNTGIKTHRPVQIDISCPDGAVVTALYATAMSGVLLPGMKDKMTMQTSSGNTAGTAAAFWLTDSDGKTINLEGSGATSSDKRFCKGDAVALRSCSVVPNTEVFADTPREEVSATVKFSIVYP